LKQAEILKVLAKEFGSNEVLALNKILKAKLADQIKFKLMGQALGYLGFTVVIKNITSEGLKIFDIGRVRLIRFEDIETFEKAKPKVPRPVRSKTPKVKAPTITSREKYKKEDDGFGEPPKKTRPVIGSTFIPKKSRR
jgi:hypothetical protein